MKTATWLGTIIALGMLNGVPFLACAGDDTKVPEATVPKTAEAEAESKATPPAAKSLQTGGLPWQSLGDAKPSGKSNVSIRELLKLLGVDDSHWQALFDGRDLISDENETITKIMYRMPRFEPHQWEQWCQKDVPWEELRTKPGEFRTQCYLLRGRALQVEKVAILKELVPLYEYRDYYRVTLAIEGQSQPVVVCTRKIPELWGDDTTLDQPVVIQAMFMKTGELREQQQTLYFAASRIGWYPAAIDPAMNLSEGLVWLAAQGFDVALLDDVRDKNGTAFSTAESECFYQLLAKISAVKPAEMKSLKAHTFDLAGMLQTPEKLQGHVFHCAGTARRIQKVSVPASFRERLGIDHYYEIDIFIPLENQPVRLSTGKDDKNAPTFTDGFPTTLCVTKLPKNLRESADMKEYVKLKGVFYRQWIYRSDFLKQFGTNLKQPAPLLMGLEPELVPLESPISDSAWGPTVYMMIIILGIGALWLTVWRFTRGDVKFDKNVLSKYTRGNEPRDEKIELPPNP